VSQYQKGETSLDFTEARDSEWQWHQLGTCKSALCSRQITTPARHRSVFFTGRMPFLPPNQRCQSTEGDYFPLRPSAKNFSLKPNDITNDVTFIFNI